MKNFSKPFLEETFLCPLFGLAEKKLKKNFFLDFVGPRKLEISLYKLKRK